MPPNVPTKFWFFLFVCVRRGVLEPRIRTRKGLARVFVWASVVSAGAANEHTELTALAPADPQTLGTTNFFEKNGI